MTDPIPAGYQLHVSTWENDGDAGMTQVWSGLTKEDCSFLIDLAKQFSSSSHGTGLGNDGVEAEVLLERFFEVYARHPGISEDMKLLFEEVSSDAEDPEEAADILYEILCDQLLGFPVEEFYSTHYERFCRVYDGHTVYLIPQAAEDRTHEFEV